MENIYEETKTNRHAAAGVGPDTGAGDRGVSSHCPGFSGL